MKTLNQTTWGSVSGGVTAVGVDLGRVDTNEIAMAAGVGAGLLGAAGLVSGTLNAHKPGNALRDGDSGLSAGATLGILGALIGAALGALGSFTKQKYQSTHTAILP